MHSSLLYIHLPPSSDPPEVKLPTAFKAVVIIELAHHPDWRNRVCKWLVDSGCLYMMAWGVECGMWDDAVDWANLEQFDFGPVPDDKFVQTTWHEEDPIEEVMWFAENAAQHSTVELGTTLLLHIANEPNEQGMRQLHSMAQEIDPANDMWEPDDGDDDDDF